ncbi:OB-fold nucleic acid binding domain-containing protein [Citricoccus nitrophenolicus]|uniref:ATP-dependent DNA helicase RecG n=1 Tax=Citricoccus muralis TaxID=169134 RepID=A0A3D9LAZ8_9MICC|nr:OB-fold nucleic acid binding domain-containing protein [Citricoccus muralis]REE03302.1 hypothetical protein C8E99_1109 [Citricoccus muralis]
MSASADPVPPPLPQTGSGRAARREAHGALVKRVGLVAAVRLTAAAGPVRFAVDLVTEAPRPGRVSTGGERLRLVWIGQRRIPGIEAGRWLRIEGFLSEHDDLPTVFNPRYELLAGAPHDPRS